MNMFKDLLTSYVAASAAALLIGLYVLWGPSTSSRRRRRVPVIGLQNLGFTCFLNSLLQALASCPIFIRWLEVSQHGSISQSLLKVLKVLNSDAVDSSTEEPHSPIEILNALRQNGWVILPGEQDVHELFHYYILTLEEESQKSNTNLFGCLSDALLPPVSSIRPSITTSKSVSAHNVFPKSLAPLPSSSSTPITSNGSVSCVETSGHGDLDSDSVKCDINRNPLPSPFTGLLTSQTNCTKCGFKSVLRYDKFDSLSLHLPPPGTGIGNREQRHTLTQLLERFVKAEVVSGVDCDGCNRGVTGEGSTPILSTALKTLSIGKLPKCLCFHIPRTLIHENGQQYKREDHVEFPEFLAMDPYTQNAIMKDNKNKKQKLNNGIEAGEDVAANSNCGIKLTSACNHFYRIKAVIVHKGPIMGGHFVTYRRGPLLSHIRHRSNQMKSHVEERWYLTSDADVSGSSLCEALSATAYMLFYEKCAIAPS